SPALSVASLPKNLSPQFKSWELILRDSELDSTIDTALSQDFDFKEGDWVRGVGATGEFSSSHHVFHGARLTRLTLSVYESESLAEEAMNELRAAKFSNSQITTRASHLKSYPQADQQPRITENPFRSVEVAVPSIGNE